jgi:hypothetical protein
LDSSDSSDSSEHSLYYFMGIEVRNAVGCDTYRHISLAITEYAFFGDGIFPICRSMTDLMCVPVILSSMLSTRMHEFSFPTCDMGALRQNLEE